MVMMIDEEGSNGEVHDDDDDFDEINDVVAG
jgi:hypothetical protein